MLRENNRRYLLALVVGVLCVGILSVSVESARQKTARSRHVRTTFDLKRYTQDKPFRLNTLQTTPYGPAWADILLENSNFLECRGAAIALCYYSGAGPTTPCVPDGLGIANCTCYEIPAGQPYKVDMNAILNLDVYLRTVAKCGSDGSLCRPTGTIDAPVCDAINNNTLIPGADLISTFSLYLEKQLPIKPTTCSTPAAYAGCMTAPCKRTGKTDPNTGLPLVQCGCPTYTGPYQVGQAQDQCVLEGNYIWSAAYNPNMTGQ